MSETMLQYQVTGDGEVINLKTKEGTAYKVSFTKVTKLPWSRRGQRVDKWQALKRMVCHLPVITTPEEWYICPTIFPDKNELKLARNSLGKWKEDTFMQSMLNGKTLELTADYNNLRLAARVIAKPEEELG